MRSGPEGKEGLSDQPVPGEVRVSRLLEPYGRKRKSTIGPRPPLSFAERDRRPENRIVNAVLAEMRMKLAGLVGAVDMSALRDH